MLSSLSTYILSILLLTALYKKNLVVVKYITTWLFAAFIQIWEKVEFFYIPKYYVGKQWKTCNLSYNLPGCPGMRAV